MKDIDKLIENIISLLKEKESKKIEESKIKLLLMESNLKKVHRFMDQILLEKIGVDFLKNLPKEIQLIDTISMQGNVQYTFRRLYTVAFQRKLLIKAYVTGTLGEEENYRIEIKITQSPTENASKETKEKVSEITNFQKNMPLSINEKDFRKELNKALKFLA